MKKFTKDTPFFLWERLIELTQDIICYRVVKEYERTFVFNDENLSSELLNIYVGLLLAVLNVDVITLEKSRI